MAGSEHFPDEVLPQTALTISLGERYPYERPQLRVSPIVFHPNVWPNGDLCMGTRWMPTESLDVSVRRALRILTFDPELTNPGSPANGTAAAWYREAVRRHPADFPSDRIDFDGGEAGKPKTLRWVDVSPSPREFSCPGCNASLKATASAGARVRCPRCRSVVGMPA
jgi:hypothetical protein